MTQVIWSPQSLHDLEAIHRYIALDSAVYAEAMVRRLVAAVERLKDFPESGRIVPECDDSSIREVIVGTYRIVYRRRCDNVEIVTVFRGSRLLPELPT